MLNKNTNKKSPLRKWRNVILLVLCGGIIFTVISVMNLEIKICSRTDDSCKLQTSIVNLDIQTRSEIDESCKLQTKTGDFFVDFGGKTLTSQGSITSITKDANMPAGSYDVFLQAYDGYDSRDKVTQKYEQYLVSFFDDSGFITQTQPTKDLPDYVKKAEWYGQVNSDLLIKRNLNKVSAKHAFYDDTSSPNSVRPICMVMRPKEICGDTIKTGSEECDDGNKNDGDGCSSKCRLEICGDGIKQANEECDDGNKNDGDGCSSKCKLESCGDGIKQPSEECDDGNTNNGDGCSSACRLESCGDGIKQASEECDDGNTNNGDGCSAECRLEEKEEEKKIEEKKECNISIGDQIWYDDNGNGEKDKGEKGIPKITLKLFKGNDIKTDKTNSSGKYKFDDLCKDGHYTVSVDTKNIPDGCYPIYDPDGKLDNSYKFSVSEGENFKKADFGYRCPKAPATGPGLVSIVVSTFLAMILAIVIKKYSSISASLKKIIKK